jgi:hypothetical protein
MPGASAQGTARPTETEVVVWLQRGLTAQGLAGRAVREVIVDADASYLRAPFRRQLEPTGTIWIGDWRPDVLVRAFEGEA